MEPQNNPYVHRAPSDVHSENPYNRENPQFYNQPPPNYPNYPYIGNPIYNPNPATYSAYPVGQIIPQVAYVPPGNQVAQPLINQHPSPLEHPIISTMHRSLAFVIFTVLTGFEIFCLGLCLGVPWFDYCYWSFYLYKFSKVRSNGSSRGDDDYSISELYDSICNYGRKPPFPECPDLCKSLKQVRYTGYIMLGFLVAAFIIVCLNFILAFLKYRKPTRKINKYLMYFFNGIALVLYLVGFIIYYKTSKFTTYFYDTDNETWYEGPNDFLWAGGLVFSVICMGAMAFKFLISKPTVGSL